MSASFTEHVFASVSEKCAPFCGTDNDVEPAPDVERLEVDVIVAHQIVCRWSDEKKSL